MLSPLRDDKISLYTGIMVEMFCLQQSMNFTPLYFVRRNNLHSKVFPHIHGGISKRSQRGGLENRLGSRPRGFESLFLRQKMQVELTCIFLSIAIAVVYHHAVACISSPKVYIINRKIVYFRNDDIQNFVLMIYKALL